MIEGIGTSLADSETFKIKIKTIQQINKWNSMN